MTKQHPLQTRHEALQMQLELDDMKTCARRFTLDEIEEADDMECGFCLDCGFMSGPAEPDARQYRCEHCGAHKVYGAMEIALMGLTE